jgi:pimeloyl-ACP methyl ester carboxylesterase
MADPVSGAPIIDELHHRHPTAAVTRLEQAAHYPHLECPEQVAAALPTIWSEVP